MILKLRMKVKSPIFSRWSGHVSYRPGHRLRCSVSPSTDSTVQVVYSPFWLLVYLIDFIVYYLLVLLLMLWSFELLIYRQFSLFVQMDYWFSAWLPLILGPGSSVGIATGYRLDGLGIESRWGEIFRTRPEWTWGPPSLLYNGYRVFPGDKATGTWCWTTHPLLVPRSRKSRAIPLPPWALGYVTGYLYLTTYQ
jgi:hypothetical protein